jgi:hypothetical protein
MASKAMETAIFATTTQVFRVGKRARARINPGPENARHEPRYVARRIERGKTPFRDTRTKRRCDAGRPFPNRYTWALAKTPVLHARRRDPVGTKDEILYERSRSARLTNRQISRYRCAATFRWDWPDRNVLRDE